MQTMIEIFNKPQVKNPTHFTALNLISIEKLKTFSIENENLFPEASRINDDFFIFTLFSNPPKRD